MGCVSDVPVMSPILLPLSVGHSALSHVLLNGPASRLSMILLSGTSLCEVVGSNTQNVSVCLCAHKRFCIGSCAGFYPEVASITLHEAEGPFPVCKLTLGSDCSLQL